MRNGTKNALTRGEKTSGSSRIAGFRYSEGCHIEDEISLVSAV